MVYEKVDWIYMIVPIGSFVWGLFVVLDDEYDLRREDDLPYLTFNQNRSSNNELYWGINDEFVNENHKRYQPSQTHTYNSYRGTKKSNNYKYIANKCKRSFKITVDDGN